MSHALENVTSGAAAASGEIAERLARAKTAFYSISMLPVEVRNRALRAMARLVEEHSQAWLSANRQDQDTWQGKLAEELFARLCLSESRIREVARGIRDVEALPDPIGRVLDRTLLDDGLTLDKVTVPLGVIAMVFESRPDVLPQILALALKSGNSAVVKGGSETRASNRAFMAIIEEVEAEVPELPHGWATLIETRDDFHELLRYPEYVDLVIPRGSNELVRAIMDATQIPVLGHADGICHTYIHQAADLDKAIRVAIDGKAQYPAVCNATETLLVDARLAPAFLPRFAEAAAARGVVLKACERTRGVLADLEPAGEEDWSAEYLDLRLAVRVVDGLDQAIEHINRYGSHHTDAIVTEDAAAREAFLARVDSATVIANASTRFADGYRFGLGAEVGISTLKTHARGPVGLEGLTIYKYVLRGAGQIVADYVGPNARPFRHKKI